MKSRALRPINLPAGLAEEPSAEAAADARAANDDASMVEIPLLGRIAAGAPILAQENVEDTLRIDRDMVRGGREVFALRVQGDSMKKGTTGTFSYQVCEAGASTCSNAAGVTF